MQKRVGILGGSFDPLHNAHLAMAQAAITAAQLDYVLLMSAGVPPHKQIHTPPLQRHETAVLAAAAHPYLVASDMEIRRRGKSYSVDTLRTLQKKHPDTSFFLIIGGDMLESLDTWHDAAALMRIASFIAFGRAQSDVQKAAHRLRESYGARIQLVDAAIPPISSTMVRARMGAALPIGDLVPPTVEQYLYAMGLYMDTQTQTLVQACRERLDDRRFLHTISTAIAAVSLADFYGADREKTRLAAFLHDIGRSVEWDALAHAPVGEAIARDELGVTDPEILQAIRTHTTLRAGATDLEKIVYLADAIECGRDYAGVEALRAAAKAGLNKAVALALTHTLAYLEKKNIPIQHDTIDAQKELAAQLSGFIFPEI